MTLEELFINIKYKYDNTGIGRARSDISTLRTAVDGLSGALDVVKDKLNLLTAASVAGATAGTVAYSGWSRSMVELAGKAGLTIKQFKELSREASSISRHAGISGDIVRESQQRAHSLGASRRLTENLARYGSILQATGQANSAEAVEAAMALQNSGLGRASANLQMAHAAAQLGGGNVPDYFLSAKGLAATAAPAGVTIEDLLALLTIGSRGKSLSGAEAGIDQFLLAINRKPEKERGEFFKTRTGQEWGQLDSILRTQGVVALLRYISSHFTESEMFKLFGEKEAIKTVSLLLSAIEDLEENRKGIASAPERDSIGSFDDDTFKEFSRVMSRFWTSIKQLVKAFGKPFATILNPLVRALTWLLNGVLTLNETLAGALAWLPALATIALLFRKILIPATIYKLGQWMFSGLWRRIPHFELPTADPDKRARNRSRRQSRYEEILSARAANQAAAGAAAGATGATLGATIGGLLKGWGIGIANFFKGTFSFFRDFDIWKEMAKTGTGAGHYGGRFFTTQALPKIFQKFVTFPITGAIVGLTKGLLGIFKWLGIILLPLALYAKIRQWDRSAEQATWSARDAQADYFRAKGLPGGEPAPGRADIAAARRKQAEAERDILEQAWEAHMGEVYDAIRDRTPDFILFMFDGINDLIDLVAKGFDAFFTSIGNFVRDLFSDPRALLSAVWDDVWRKDAELDSWILRKYLESVGKVPPEADAMGIIGDRSSSTNLAQPVIRLTRANARALGMEGGDYSQVLNAPNVDKIILPTPPENMTPQSVSNEVVINVGDIIVGDSQGTDRLDRMKEIQDAIRSELRNSADYIIQEMDWATP